MSTFVWWGWRDGSPNPIVLVKGLLSIMLKDNPLHAKTSEIVLCCYLFYRKNNRKLLIINFIKLLSHFLRKIGFFFSLISCCFLLFFQDNNRATPKVSTFLCFLFTVVLPKSHFVHPANKQTCHWSDDIGPIGDWLFIQLKRNLAIEGASTQRKKKEMSYLQNAWVKWERCLLPQPSQRMKKKNQMHMT